MATGTTYDSALTRNSCLEGAYRKIGALRRGQNMSASQLADGIAALNLIIREEDARGTQQSKNLWALDEKTLLMQAGGHVYNVESDGLAAGIVDIISAVYRDASGDDVPLDIITAEQYEAIGSKDDTGTPEKIYLKRDATLSCQLLYVWPALSSVSTPDEVLGSDGLNYRCVIPHTSAAINKPITGTSYRIYWEQAGTAGTTWATATDYTSSEVIRYAYKRPLYDFVNADDNPDMPQGWGRYLMLRLAHDLAPEYGIALDERQWLEKEYMKSRAEIFPNTQPISNSHYNKAVYF